jgi:hypothetical protein
MYMKCILINYIEFNLFNELQNNIFEYQNI